MVYFFRVLFFSSLFLPTLVLSQELGVNTYVSSFQLNDSDGSTESVIQFQPLNFYYTDKLKIDTRYWTEITYTKMKLNASTFNIGQNVLMYGVSGALQKRLRYSRNIKPWIGAGFSYFSVKSTIRHTLDQEGFLAQKYPRRMDNNFDLYFIASNYWELNKKWNVGIVTRLIPPLIGNVFLFSAGISVSYN